MIKEMKCKKCEYTEEFLLKLSEFEEGGYKKKKCPKCKSNMKEVISVPNFRLKGNKWERDGYSGKIDSELKTALNEHDMHRKNEDKLNKN